MHEENTVITLTYSSEHIPADGSINPDDAVRFMKRLRAREDYAAKTEGRLAREIKTYGCAEYGEKFGRPHYHIILFNYDFADKVQIRGRDPEYNYYQSDTLEEIWGKGRCEIMDLTWETAAYVARYCMKKLTQSAASPPEIKQKIKERGTKLPEQKVCASQKGIGKEWYKKWKSEIYKGDRIVLRGQEMRAPNYYDRQYEIENPDDWKKIKAKRKYKNKKRDRQIEQEILEGNYTNAFNKGIGDRDRANDECVKAKAKMLKRSYENET